MRLATVRIPTGTRAVRVEGSRLIPLDAADVGEALAVRAASGALPPELATEPIPLAKADFAPLVTRPAKVFCVGLNYRPHILEMGRQLPSHPTLFAKFASTLIGAHDDLVLPEISGQIDWEAELGVVIGAPVHRATPAEARDAIAGYTVVNDVTMRDWQYRTTQWLQGKALDASTPVGPCLVTPDDVDHAADLELRCEVDDVVMQRASTADLLFPPAELVSYISQFTRLQPGDLIATGTPGGVGSARDPKIFLAPGQVVRTVIEGLGECVNFCRKEES